MKSVVGANSLSLETSADEPGGNYSMVQENNGMQRRRALKKFVCARRTISHAI
jgi:hypothetical protein